MTAFRELVVSAVAAAVAVSCAATPSPVVAESAAAATDVAKDGPPPLDRLPVSWDLDVPAVEASLGAGAPLRLLLDTGASSLVVSQRVVEERKLECVDLPAEGPSSLSIDTNGGEVPARRIARIPWLRLGSFTFLDVRAVVVDLSGIEGISGLSFDGAFPAAALRGGLLTFDFARKTVAMSAGELPPADGVEILDLVKDQWRPFVLLDVGGSPCPTLLDTGGRLFLELPEVREASYKFRAPPRVAAWNVTVAGVVERRMARLDEDLAVGRHRVAAPVVGLTRGRHALAGLFLLSEFRTTFDFANARVRFERRGDAPIVSKPVRGPGLGWRHADDAWRIGYVLAGSAAERAGLKVGDMIKTLDGRPVKDVGFAGYEDRLESDVPLRFGVADGSGVREVVVPVETIVE